MLTEVHRQAEDDPIVRLSMDVRAGRDLEPGIYGETRVVETSELDPQRVIDADQVLVGRNDTRRAYNARMRERRGFAGALPGNRRQARLPAQQQAQGTVQRRALVGEGKAIHAARHHQDAALSRTTTSRRQADQGLGAAGVLHRRHRAARMAAAQALRRVRLRLCADRAQGAGLAMGRRGAVRRVVRVPARAASAGSTPA